MFLNYLYCLSLMEENWLNKSSDLCLVVILKNSQSTNEVLEDWEKR